MLRAKLFKSFACLVIVLGIASAVFGVRVIKQRVIDEAQTRVRLDLSSAWAVWNGRLREVGIILQLAAGKQGVTKVCEERAWSDPVIRGDLDRVRADFGLDFLDLVDPDGKMVMRTTPPYATNDYRLSDPIVAKALKGEPAFGMSVLSAEELARESDGLAERAFLQLEQTPQARLTQRTEETRGMAMTGAAPVWRGGQVIGVVYGGMLVNRNEGLIDHIHNVLFRNEQYKGVCPGTATIFLGDTRIATTVRLANGNRALGTRVSKEVADSVLDNGKPWVAEAFVVRERYLTAYEPIRDAAGRIVGMLYVGILKRPFQDTERNVLLTYVLLSVAALCIALVLAFVLAGRLAGPIHQLVEAANRLTRGEPPGTVEATQACYETEVLTRAFNQMARTLREREERLTALNRNYMETLGFVSHELKGPLASLVNYLYLLREQKIGPLNEKQGRAVRAIDSGVARLIDMVRHYLNLSRIEKGELQPARTRVAVLDEVLNPVLEAVGADLAARKLRVLNEVGPDAVLHADINMVREIFENLIGNAVKYGREGGELRVSGRAQDGWFEFAVRNDGEGIPADQMGELFQRFSRGKSLASVRRERGAGLGLFITRCLVEAHGGSIRADSQPGQWAEFSFRLPRMPEAPG